MALLACAKKLGVDFASTAMIGRQNFSGAGLEPGLRRMFETLGIRQDPREFRAKNHFCEELFRLLGAQQVDSFDVSGYQQATHLHDMNQPIPAAFRERYSCVHDGGTIEHVFNIPQALKNCLQMVQLGGHLTQVNIANNFMGHGFWQFSPEMVFRTMSPENGFEIRAVFLHEVIPGGCWHLVADPEKVHRRVELCNSHPTFILTIARRVEIKEIFAKPPQQSDYVEEWSAPHQQAPEPPGITPRKPPLIRRIPRKIRRVITDSLAQAGHALQRHPVFGPLKQSITGPPIYDPMVYRRLREEQVWLGDF